MSQQDFVKESKPLKLGAISNNQLLYRQNSSYRRHQDARRDSLAALIVMWTKRYDASAELYPSNGVPRLLDNGFQMTVTLNDSEKTTKCETLIKTLQGLFPDALISKQSPHSFTVELLFQDPQPFATSVMIVALLIMGIIMLFYLQTLINPGRYGIVSRLFSLLDSLTTMWFGRTQQHVNT